MTGFNVYTPYLISEGGLTNSQVSVVLMVRNLLTLVSMFLVVPLIRKVDLRMNMTIAIGLAAVSFALFSIAGNFPMFCLAMTFGGLAYGLGGMVSVSIIIKRWFGEHDGLALGICAAGTGLSAVVGAPVLTAMVEGHGMRYSFRMEALFMVVVAALMFLLIRNYPSKEKEHEVEEIRRAKIADRKHHEIFHLSHAEWFMMMLGVLLCGMSYNVSPYLTVLYREKSFDAATVGWLMSFMGLTLMAGKIVYGEAVDILGRVKSGNIFHGCFVAAVLLCALCIPGNKFMAYAAMALLGIGFPMLSVGLSELAAGTAKEEFYSDGVKQVQIVYMLGSLVFGPVPGMMADAMGNYTAVYFLLAGISLAAALLQQLVLAKCSRTEHE
ncbi:MAG: MFS transporter [Lachnospiraceae bacterium]|nr:MFS transporter [Lachnospiraceae bacterium]